MVDAGSLQYVGGARIEGELRGLGSARKGYVYLCRGGEIISCCETDTQGGYGFTVWENGLYTLIATDSDGNGVSSPLEVTVTADTGTMTVNPELGLGSFQVSNINSLVGINGVKVKLTYLYDGCEVTVEERSGVTSISQIFSGLAFGNYRLDVVSDTGSSSCIFAVTGLERVYVNIGTLKSTNKVVFNVTDDNAESLDGVALYVYQVSTQTLVGVWYTDGDGSVEVSGLSDGDYVCAALSRDGRMGLSSRISVDGQESLTHRMILSSLQTGITGSVSGVGSSAIVDTRVELYDSFGYIIGAGNVESDGSYQVGSLASGIALIRFVNYTTGQEFYHTVSPGISTADPVEIPPAELPAATPDPVLPTDTPESPGEPDIPEDEEPTEDVQTLNSPSNLACSLNKGLRSATLSWSGVGNPEGITYEVICYYSPIDGVGASGNQSFASNESTTISFNPVDNSRYSWIVLAYGVSPRWI